MECRLVGRDQTGTGAAFDRHVADRHARIHVESADGGPRELEDMARAAAGADLGDHGEDHILSGNARRQPSIKVHTEIFRFALEQALRREHHLDFAGADPMREGAERAVRGRVAISTNERPAGLRQAKLGTNHVDDSLLRAAEVVQRYAKLGAIRRKHPNLLRRHLIETGQRAARRRNRVIHRSECFVGAAHFQAAFSQSRECLGSCDFVNEVNVDIENGGSVRLGHDDVRVPDFVV